MRAFFDGGISSVGRALDCDSRCHRFDPGMSPQYYENPLIRQRVFSFTAANY